MAHGEHHHNTDGKKRAEHKLLQLLNLGFSHLSIRFTTTLTSEQVHSHCNNLKNKKALLEKPVDSVQSDVLQI